MDHIEFFRNGGNTSINNMLPLCTRRAMSPALL